MEFNVARLMRLSGITPDEETRTLTESTELSEVSDDTEDVMEESDEEMEASSEEITEATVRRVVKEEIQAALDRLKNERKRGGRIGSDSDWLYGNKKPKNSRAGLITKGFRGVGFI